MKNKDVRLVNFSNLTSDQLSEIAKIHKNVMGYSINAQLGIEHLIALYKILQYSMITSGFAAIENGKIIGCALGTSNLDQVNSLIKKMKLFIIVKCLNPRYLISNIMNIFDQLQISLITKKFNIRGNYILVWFVEERYVGQGIAIEMLKELELDLFSKNKSNIYVDVRKSSVRALSAYYKLGYLEHAETRKSFLLTKMS